MHRPSIASIAAVLITALGAFLRLRAVFGLDVQGNEMAFVGTPPADALSLDVLLYYAPLRPLLTALAMAVAPGVVVLRALAWVPGVLVPLAFFAAFRPVAGAAAALAATALLAFDDLQAAASIESGIYALAILLQIAALWAHREVVSRGRAGAARVWAAASMAMLLTHYLLFPFVVLTALTTTLGVRRRACPSLSKAWKRALLAVAAVALPLGALLAYGLVFQWLRTAGGGLARSSEVTFTSFWSLGLLPQGLGHPVATVGVVLAAAVAALRRPLPLAAATAHWLGFLAVMAASLTFLPRLADYHAVLLHVPVLVWGLTLVAPVSTRPGVRGAVRAGALGVVLCTAALAFGAIRVASPGRFLGMAPLYSPLAELVQLLRASQSPEVVALVHPPNLVSALSFQRRPSDYVVACSDRIDGNGATREITCPEGIVRGVWSDEGRRRLLWDLPASAYLAAVEKTRAWGLDATRGVPDDWFARGLPAASLGLPAACELVPSTYWLLYRCPSPARSATP